MSDSLKRYKAKRNFSKTSEPAGDETARKGGPTFVIQKHDASRLHYDFRLEVDGALKSWVLPKGPSTDPKDKRMAIPVEDHPVDYAEFEGVIPEGEYGAGTVLVWDTGTYRNLMAEKDEPMSMADSIKAGHVEIRLGGKKLGGGYALVKFRKGKDEAWLLIKMDDEKADARRNPVSTEPDSVLTGKSLEEIREAVDQKK